MTVDLAEWFGEGEIPTACEVCDSDAPVVGVVGTAEHLGGCQRCVDRWKAPRMSLLGPGISASSSTSHRTRVRPCSGVRPASAREVMHPRQGSWSHFGRIGGRA